MAARMTLRVFSFNATMRFGSPVFGGRARSVSVKSSTIEPPDVPKLAESARIALTSQEIEEFTPKIGKVVEWFGQLQVVNLEDVEPTSRADMDVCDNLRPDTPDVFANREAMLSAVPSYEEPYIKVPKVLNKE